MEKLIKALQRLGPFGSALANVLTFLTTNWAVVMTTALSFWVGLSDWATDILQKAGVQSAIIFFLASLWTYIGFRSLIDRTKPTTTKPFQDYAYGLTYEGVGLGWDPSNPDAMLQLSVMLRNFNAVPTKYRVEKFDVVVSGRTLDPTQHPNTAYFIPRGGARLYRAPAFVENQVKDLQDKRITGYLDFSIVYGHPNGAPERRLRMKVQLSALLSDPPAYADRILHEADEPIDMVHPTTF